MTTARLQRGRNPRPDSGVSLHFPMSTCRPHSHPIMKNRDQLMKTLFPILAIFLLTALGIHARTWTSADGKSTFEGELIGYNTNTGEVTLDRGGKHITFKQQVLSESDIAFLKNWKPSATPTPAGARQAQPVAEHGLLKIAGGKLCSASGQPVQLKGMSLFWSQWGGNWYTTATVESLADQWGCTLVRAAMAVESGGYLTQPDKEKAKVRTVVDAAITQGIYVIIDWHDHNAEQHLPQAKEFFTEMATAYKNVPNVMFEIYNEPVKTPWPVIKSYAESVIKAIRSIGAQNVIIVGTPKWSQDVNKAADDPIKGSNIAYTLHFYAGSHNQNLRDKASYAMNKGLALVVTEWGTCDASGNGGFNEAESEKWMQFLDANKLSWANWSLFDKKETASAVTPGSSPTGPWGKDDLTPSGLFVTRHFPMQAANSTSELHVVGRKPKK